MADHRKPASKRKTVQIGVRMTPAEKKLVEETAARLGFENASAWLRRIVMNAVATA